jgi:AraC family transcriptional regulator
MLRSFAGACVRRVIDRSRMCVPAHAHDWPVLSLFVIGSYLNETELGEASIYGPSAVLYRAGAVHRNVTFATGFEQIEIEFDPGWLGSELLPPGPVTRWIGGHAGTQVRLLVRACEAEASELRLREALRSFLRQANLEPVRRTADWIDGLARRLREDNTLKVADVAREVGRHPSWVGCAYRQAIGETPQQTAARLRVESASHLLRESDKPCADIAAEAGFCDQSHMNRTFRRVLGRTPLTVRLDRSSFRQNSGVTAAH